MKLCPSQELCQSYSNGSKWKVHRIRITDVCRYWNGEYCTHKIAGVKSGDACNLEKIRKIKGELKYLKLD